MSAKFKEGILKLHKQLSNDKSLRLLNFYMPPPLPVSKLKKLGLNNSILEFYAEMNGFQLSYVFNENVDFDKGFIDRIDSAFPHLWPNENYWHLDGCINILPAELMFESDWQGYIWFESEKKNYIAYKGKQVLQTAFEKKLKPLDVFSKASIAVINATSNSFEVLLSTDHNASYTDYNPVSFGDYINGLLQTKGVIEKRKSIFLQEKNKDHE